MGAVYAIMCSSPAAQGQALNADQFAAKLAAAAQDGDSSARVRFKVIRPGTEPQVYQLRILSRRSANNSRVRYAVLWPADRKGESFSIEQRGASAAQGTLRSADGKISTITARNAPEPVLGSDLAYQDVIENFFLWKNQVLAGSEKIAGTDCVILESKASPQDSTPYGKVRCWVDAGRFVVMRVEKFDKSGHLVRSIETTGVAKDDLGRNVPSSMIVRVPGSPTSTEIEGAGIRHDAAISDKDFSVSGE